MRRKEKVDLLRLDIAGQSGKGQTDGQALEGQADEPVQDTVRSGQKRKNVKAK